jgi:hypothetical protein
MKHPIVVKLNKVLMMPEKVTLTEVGKTAILISLICVQIAILPHFFTFINTGGLTDIGVISDVSLLGFSMLILIALLFINVIIYSIILRNPKMLIISFVLEAIAIAVFMPVFKYHTYLTPRLYGCWDTLGHYSFALWILKYGKIPLNTNLYYSSTYGFHPGTPLIPFFYSIIAGVPLDLSISLMLLVSYVVYSIALYNIIRRTLLERSLKITLDTTLLSILMLVLPLYYPYYTGSSASSIFVALLFYIMIISILYNRLGGLSFIVTYIVLYIGLYLTHFSTTVIYSATVLFMLGLLYVVFRLRGEKTINIARLSYLALVTISLAAVFELYVDVLLLGYTLQQAIRDVILKLYVAEVQGYVQPKKYFLPLYLRMWNYFASYPKEILLLILQVSLTLYAIITLRRSIGLQKQRSYRHVMYSILLSSYIPIVVSWAGVGKLITASARYIITKQFLLLSSLLLILHEKTNSNNFIKRRHSALSIVVAVGIAVLILSNYGLSGLSAPVIYGGREAYLYVANGLVSPYVLHAHQYLNSHIEQGSSMRLCCLQPFTSFGICDLSWNTSYDIVYMERNLECDPAVVLALLAEYPVGLRCQIVPIPLREGVCPVCYKLGDFYVGLSDLVPRSFSMIYNSGFYSLHVIIRR